MGSKEIYKEIKLKLNEFLRNDNFETAKGSFPAWTKKIENKYLTFWFQCARQGGQLTIDFQYANTPEPGSGKWNERKRVFGLLDKDVEKFKGFTRGDSFTKDDFWFEVKSLKDVEKITDWFKKNLNSLEEKMVRGGKNETETV